MSGLANPLHAALTVDRPTALGCGLAVALTFAALLYNLALNFWRQRQAGALEFRMELREGPASQEQAPKKPDLEGEEAKAPGDAADSQHFYVMWHSGDVQGEVFTEESAARELFAEKDGGPFAAMLTDDGFQRLRFYGKAGCIEDFRKWWQEQQQLQRGEIGERKAAKFYKGHVLDKPEFEEKARVLFEERLAMGRNAVLAMLRAPYSCPKLLNERLMQCSERASGIWLLPAMLALELLVVALWFAGVAKRLLAACGVPEAAGTAWALCAPIAVMLSVFLKLAASLRVDGEFVSIDGFEEHRRVQKATSKNIVRLGSIFYGLLSNVALAARLLPHGSEEGVEATRYEKMRGALAMAVTKAGFTDVVGDVHLSVMLSDAVCVYSLLAVIVAVVTVWVALYHPFLEGVMAVSALETTSRSRDSHFERMEHICVRMHVYERMAEKKHYTTLFLLLSDAAFLPVVTNLLKVLACDYEDGAPRLLDAPGVECWTAPHSAAAALAICCIFAYVPTCVFGTAFVLADSDGVFASPSLDVLFEPRFLVLQTLLKTLLAVTSVFVGPLSAPWALTLQFMGNALLTMSIVMLKPCSIIWVNYVASTTLSFAALFGLMALLDRSTDLQWWPFLGFLLGAAFLLLQCLLSARQGTPLLTRSKAVGPTFQDSWGFDDSSRLRGLTHRLRQLSFWMERPAGVVKGLQCIYEVDGVVTFGAPYLQPGVDDAWPKEHLTLAPRELLTEARVYWDTPKRALRLLLRTSEGQEFRAGFEEGTRHKVQSLEVDQGSRVLALHGGIGGGLHSLGFVLESSDANMQASEQAPLLQPA